MSASVNQGIRHRTVKELKEHVKALTLKNQQLSRKIKETKHSIRSTKENHQAIRILYALVETCRSKIQCDLEQFQPKLVPIPLMEQTFCINTADVLSKDKIPKSNRKPVLSIKRCTLPLVPAYCITTHKSQGQTWNKVVIDLQLPNEADDIAAIYVPLSRVKRLTDLIILRQFDYKVLLIKPSKSQLAEIERLDKLYLETQTSFSKWS